MERSSLIGTIVLLAAIAATFILSSCQGLVPTSSNTNTTLTQHVATAGRVVYRENGAFFGILADDGRQYEPVNLDPAYHVEGLRVKFTGSRDTLSLGRHQWGNPVDIAQVESSK